MSLDLITIHDALPQKLRNWCRVEARSKEPILAYYPSVAPRIALRELDTGRGQPRKEPFRKYQKPLKRVEP